MSWITAPFAWLLKALYELTGSYGWAVILFGVVVNLILLPFMAKSKKSMMRTSRLQPRIAELQRRHEGNQQKLNEEMAKLYREEKINPMSGCLWSLIPFPILIALYSVIRQPLTKMMSLSADAVTQLTDWVTTNAGYVAQTKSAYQEIQIADLIHQNWDAVTGALGDFSGKLLDIDYSFIGLNMGQQPSFKIWTFDWSNKAVWLPALGLFLIPIVSAVLSWLSMKISTSMTPQPAANQQQAATTNKTMMIMMPLVSLWICYTMPAALGIYWIVNSVLGILRDVSLTKVFNKQLDKLDAERIARELASREVGPIRVYNLSYADPSVVLRDVFRFDTLIVGGPTYNGNLFPPVAELLDRIAARGIPRRRFGWFGSFCWAGASVRLLAEFAQKMKWEPLCDPVEMKQGYSHEMCDPCATLAEAVAGCRCGK